MQASASLCAAPCRPSARRLRVFCSAQQQGAGRPAPQSAAWRALTVAGTAGAAMLVAFDALAVSGGGGLGTSLAGKDFSGQDLRSQKLYKAELRGTNFSKANLAKANLFGSLAKGANFSGADLSFADIESVDFDGADLTDAVLEGAQAINAQFKGTKVANTDWTDAVLSKNALRQLCSIAEGTNPKTGVDTRESLMCP